MKKHNESNLTNESWLADLPKDTQLENNRDQHTLCYLYAGLEYQSYNEILKMR